MSDSETWRDQRESRYELSRDTAERVVSKLSDHLPVVLYNGGPPTSLVATVYYDTSQSYYLRLAMASNGTTSIKIRVREYFPISNDNKCQIIEQSGTCFLERKERTGDIRSKDRIRIEKKDLAAIIEHTVALPENCEFLRKDICKHSLKPVLISMYERRVWGNDDLRITFDERIRYHRPPAKIYDDPQTLSPDQLGAPDSFGPKRILEVKYSAQSILPPWLDNLLDRLPKAIGFSKFVDGMGSLRAQSHSQTRLTPPIFQEK